MTSCYPIAIARDAAGLTESVAAVSNLPTLGLAALGVFIGGSVAKRGTSALVGSVLGLVAGGFIGSKLNDSLQKKT